MTEKELSEKLSKGEGGSFPYPMTPERASALIVKELLSDLPLDRQQIVRRVIEDWGDEWGNSVASTAVESSHY